jgi:hypothetical protein
MHVTILGLEDEITPAWLGAALRASGALPVGEVVAVATRGNAAFNSAALHLMVTYSPDAPAAAPQHIFCKRNLDVEWAREVGAWEVEFYQLATQQGARLPMVLPCYLAAFDAASGRSIILLRDVSATHSAPVTRDQLLARQGVPSEEKLSACVDVLAAFHAAWWQHPRLGKGIAQTSMWYRGPAYFETFVARRRSEWASFLAAEGADLPKEYRATYERILAGMPALWARYLAPRVAEMHNLTLAHEDCSLSQFLCPNAGRGQTYLVDYQGTAADFGTTDLVHVCAFFWTPEQRQQHEMAVLRRYLDGLHHAGITGYSWEDLLTDYRLLITIHTTYPVWDQTNGSRKSYWWPKMQSIIAAYRDLDCAPLVD